MPLTGCRWWGRSPRPTWPSGSPWTARSDGIPWTKGSQCEFLRNTRGVFIITYIHSYSMNENLIIYSLNTSMSRQDRSAIQHISSQISLLVLLRQSKRLSTDHLLCFLFNRVNLGSQERRVLWVVLVWEWVHFLHKYLPVFQTSQTDSSFSVPGSLLII